MASEDILTNRIFFLFARIWGFIYFEINENKKRVKNLEIGKLHFAIVICFQVLIQTTEIFMFVHYNQYIKIEDVMNSVLFVVGYIGQLTHFNNMQLQLIKAKENKKLWQDLYRIEMELG